MAQETDPFAPIDTLIWASVNSTQRSSPGSPAIVPQGDGFQTNARNHRGGQGVGRELLQPRASWDS